MRNLYDSLNTVRAAIFLSVSLAFMLVYTPGQEPDPYKAWAAKAPTMADYPLEFQVVTQRDTVGGIPQYVGWTPVINGRILGRTRAGDAVIVELGQGGKTVHTMRSGLRGNRGETWFEDWEMRGNMPKDLLTAVGPITANFKYVNDIDGKTIPLAVRQFNVVRTAAWEDRKSVWKYGALYDDLLGFSYVVERQATGGSGAFVWIYTWMNLEHDSVIKDISYRVEVDGKVVPLDDGFDANQNHESIASIDQYEEVYVKATDDRVVNRHNLYLVVFRPKLMWGAKTGGPLSGGWLWLADHPGKWVLKIRLAGEVVRELHFGVLPNGEIQPHPEQAQGEAGAINLGPGRFFVETYFPSPNHFDLRFNPEAIRLGTLFGRPWTSKEVKEGMLRELPPKNPGKLPFPQPVLPPN